MISDKVCVGCFNIIEKCVSVDDELYTTSPSRKFCYNCSPLKLKYSPSVRRTKNNTKKSLNRIAFKKMCVDLKGGKCQECGYNENLAVLQFHHTDPMLKDIEITRLFKVNPKEVDWDLLRSELNKTVLLCANCHCVAHHKSKENNRDIDYSEYLNHYNRLDMETINK